MSKKLAYPSPLIPARQTSSGVAIPANDLRVGEIAVNSADGGLFVKKEDGTVAAVGGGGAQGLHYISTTDGLDGYRSNGEEELYRLTLEAGVTYLVQGVAAWWFNGSGGPDFAVNIYSPTADATLTMQKNIGDASGYLPVGWLTGRGSTVSFVPATNTYQPFDVHCPFSGIVFGGNAGGDFIVKLNTIQGWYPVLGAWVSAVPLA